MKLDNICNQVYIVAVNEANLQSHEYVTPEHLLYAALMFDLGQDIVAHCGADPKLISLDLQAYFEQYMEKVDAETPIESFSLVRLFENALNQAKNAEKSMVSIGDLMVALFGLPESFAVFILKKHGVSRLNMMKYISHGLMKGSASPIEQKQEAEAAPNMQSGKKEQELLLAYTTNLTQKARESALDPFVGREEVLERTIHVLARRNKNNPIHVGFAGVGKTAIVEGLAQRIAKGTVPPALQNANIYAMDMGTLVAGTKYRGDFEERLLQILSAVAKEKNAIVYLDEIHNAVGAGAVSGGSLDATSMLKPFLTKGELRFIGSTTFTEYKKFFEKDAALTRRFQKIDVEEPTVEEAVAMLMGIKHKYESYHGVVYSEKVVTHICQMTDRYLSERKLPDKAIDVLDETGAHLRIKNTEKDSIEVSIQDVEKTISLMAKIPENTLSENELDKLQSLEERMKTNVFGQEKAVNAVVSAIKAARSGLNDAQKPVASLLFVGPTGVGKTEIAKQLAKHLNIELNRFDMSEYQEAHSVARLIGSPPGYVGYEEGGLLTDSIRKTPHCVLLLDEIEKAHKDILNVLLQIMDYGSITDNTGRKADCRNVIIIMTSNAGASDLNRHMIGFDNEARNASAIEKEVERTFSPEFRNRLDEIVTFKHIDEDMAYQITQKAILQLGKKLAEKQVKLVVPKKTMQWIAKKGLSHVYGAREIIRVVDKDMKKMLVEEVLFGTLKNGGKAEVVCKNDCLVLNCLTI